MGEMKHCEACKGSGQHWTPGEPMKRCPKCEGTGKVIQLEAGPPPVDGGPPEPGDEG
jgi:DnaJ-class molecular chaperone